MMAWKLSMRAFCQPGSEPVGELGFGGPVAALTDGRGGALEDVDVFGRSGQGWQHLDARGASADERHRLIFEPFERRVRAAPGVVVVPAGGMEGAASEILPCPRWRGAS